MAAAQLLPLDPALLPALRAAARADEHALLFPTHVVSKGGDLVGYASLDATPIVNVWLDSKRVVALDSVRLLVAAEQRLHERGIRTYVMPCARTSPFFPHMGRLGFKLLGENVWFVKTLPEK